MGENSGICSQQLNVADCVYHAFVVERCRKTVFWSKLSSIPGVQKEHSCLLFGKNRYKLLNNIIFTENYVFMLIENISSLFASIDCISFCQIRKTQESGEK